MSVQLCLTFRFLRPYYHGAGDGDMPEWPPSPLRMFQSLVAAAAARWNERDHPTTADAALRWLEEQPAPSIVAGDATTATAPYRMYVPNNAADLVAAAWSRGNNEASVAEHRTEKDVQPMHLTDEAVHFLYSLASDDCPHFAVLRDAAQSVTHLGWGTDVVVGTAELLTDVQVAALTQDRWEPTSAGAGTARRAPVSGSLSALVSRHHAFLGRISPEGFRPVPPLTSFQNVNYRRDIDPPPRPIAAFQFLQPDGSQMRPFNTTSRTCSVAGMLRHVTGLAATEAQWAEDRISRVVFGHAASRAQNAARCVDPEAELSDDIPRQLPEDCVGTDRLAYLPLPSLEYRGKGVVVGSIRRALVTTFGSGCRDEVRWTQRSLSGRDLIDEHSGDPAALLSLVAANDKMVQRYTRSSTVWASVTPVILPGRDDRHQRKAEKLLRKAIRQAGFSATLAEHAELEWRDVCYWPGGDLAKRFFVPEHLRSYPRFHVRIVWKKSCDKDVAVSGPICLGGGRYYGMGLFAAMDSRY
ncbi:MAG TPA: type I-U CRISPR-associated protein Csb2 [Planctomycetaceae bacterium]|nr:type I-U CRISPR-associated protein Csb2 [Planctomycetaceae bacterium]